MAQRAKDVHASFFAAQPLFLKPCSRETYLAFIREHFPVLESLYRFRFDGRAFVAEAYRKRVEALVELVTRKYRLNRRSGDALLTRNEGQQAPNCSDRQGTLWPEKKPVRRATSANPPGKAGISG